MSCFKLAEEAETVVVPTRPDLSDGKKPIAELRKRVVGHRSTRSPQKTIGCQTSTPQLVRSQYALPPNAHIHGRSKAK